MNKQQTTSYKMKVTLPWWRKYYINMLILTKNTIECLGVQCDIDVDKATKKICKGVKVKLLTEGE